MNTLAFGIIRTPVTLATRSQQSPAPPRNPHGLNARQLRLCSETGADPRIFARIKREQRGEQRAQQPKRPKLTAQQLRICAETGCEPATFAKLLRSGGV